MEAQSHLDMLDVSHTDSAGVSDLLIAQEDISDYFYRLIIPKSIGVGFGPPS